MSNFTPEHFEALLAQVSIKPVINQVEFHPYLTQNKLRKYLEAQNIIMESWSPLMNSQILHDDVINEVANEGKTPAQVVIRWNIQHDVVVIPKSVTPHRIEENLDVWNFELSDNQMERIDQLNQDKRIGPNPLEFDVIIEMLKTIAFVLAIIIYWYNIVELRICLFLTTIIRCHDSLRTLIRI